MSDGVGEVREMIESDLVGPVQVLNRQQPGTIAACLRDEPGEGRALAAVAGCVVHRVIERPQLGRLRQVQEVVQVHPLLVRQHAIVEGLLGRCGDLVPAALARQAEQAADE